MKLWVKQILVPYFLSQRALHNLPVNQSCILQIDCWSVHRSARFLDWMAKTYPWIIILFVSGSCIGLQRVLTLAISTHAHADVVAEAVNALQLGTPPEQVINDQGIGTLRNRSVNWMVAGYRAIDNPELIKKVSSQQYTQTYLMYAFEPKASALCAVPGRAFTLSHESLTSWGAQQAILKLRTTHPDFYSEITSGNRSAPPPPIATSTTQMKHLTGWMKM